MAVKALNKKLIKMLGEAIESSGSIMLAIQHVKIPRSTYYYWRKLAEEIDSNNPGRENLSKDEELLIEFLDTIEFSRYNPGKKLINAAWKCVEKGDARVILHMLRSLFRDEFNPAPASIQIENDSNTTDSGTGIALIPVVSGQTNLEELLKQQQKSVMQMAHSQTARLKSDG